MTKLLVRAAFAASLVFAAATAAALSAAPAFAADKGPNLSKDVAKALMAVQTLMQQKDYQGALAQVKMAQALPDQTDEDKYYVNKFLGSIAINLKDMTTATQAYEAMVNSPAEPPEDKQATLHNALLLSGNAQHWQLVLDDAKQLEAMNGMDNATYATLAVADYQMKDTAGAVAAAQKSVDLAKAAGKTPNANALTIVANAQAQSNPQAAKQTWETMVISDPSDVDSWHNLSALAFGAGPVKNIDALYFCRLDFAVGAMKSADDYTTCAAVANLEKDYEEAKNILEAGLSSGKLSAGEAESLGPIRTKAAADERIIDAAMKDARTGEQHLGVAEDLYGYGRYADAIAQAQAAKAKGGLKDPGEADLIVGASQARAGQYDAAIQTLSAIGGTGSRKNAVQLWILYAQAKKKQTEGAAAGNSPAH